MSGKNRKRRPAAGAPSRRPTAPTPSRTDLGQREDAKRERREEARRLREAMRRRASRRRSYRNAVYALVAVAALGAILYAVTRTKHGAALSADERTLLAQASSQTAGAGCGPVQTEPEYRGGGDRAHIGSQIAAPPALSSYPSTPPASGPHDPTPLDAGVYSIPPPVYQAIHSLEHGAVIIWYDPSASGAELEKIKAFFGAPAHQDHVIVAPYSYPDQGTGGKLPAGKQMVLVAWHHLQDCSTLSLSVAFDFIVHYRFPPPAGQSYRGDAPEQGFPI